MTTTWITSYKDKYGRFIHKSFKSRKQALDFEKLVEQKLGKMRLASKKAKLLRARKVSNLEALQLMKKNPMYNQSITEWLD